MRHQRANGPAFAVLAAALWLGAPAVLGAQQPPTQPAPQSEGGTTRDAGRATENTFSGKIRKASEGKFVLEDASKSTSFTLDNQKLAKKFEGKNVVVTGTLDQTNNVLHVKKIEPVA